MLETQGGLYETVLCSIFYFLFYLLFGELAVT